jgi:hypothetical protein
VAESSVEEVQESDARDGKKVRHERDEGEIYVMRTIGTALDGKHGMNETLSALC